MSGKLKPVDPLRNLLRQKGIQAGDLIEHFGLSTSGLSNRFAIPLRWSIGELVKLAEICEVPFEQVMEAVLASAKVHGQSPTPVSELRLEQLETMMNLTGLTPKDIAKRL